MAPPSQTAGAVRVVEVLLGIAERISGDEASFFRFARARLAAAQKPERERLELSRNSLLPR